MTGWLLSLLGICDHDYGWPIRGQQRCVRCGATRAALVDFTPLPRFAVPIRPLIAIEAESDLDPELPALRALWNLKDAR